MSPESAIELAVRDDIPSPLSPSPSPPPPQASPGHDNDGNRHEFPVLPPVDGGKDAWLFLGACFMIEALVWGFPFTFGVFQNYYSTHEPFAGSTNIALIGTCAMGVMYIDAPFVMAFLQRYPVQARYSPLVGLVIMCLALALSSLCTTVPQLIATQGVLYAIGGSITYSPCIVYLDEWFARRKGLAYGVMWSGTGLAGVILPLFLEYLLSTHGYETTLRIFAGLVFALTAPLAYFVRPRVPIPSGGSSHTKPFSSFRFVYSRPFLLYQLFNAVEATGFFLPGIYLPSYASSVLKAGPFPSALPVLLLNVASVFGCVAMGSLIDRADVTTCILVSTAGATAGTFLLWGLSTNLAVLYVFAIVYGLFAGSFTSAWPGIMRDITRREKLAAEVASSSNSGSEGENNGNNRTSTADPSMVFAFLALGRGVGNVVSGPLSEALIRNSPWKGEAFSGYGSGFGTLIAFTGATALFGGGSFLWKKLGWL